VAFKPIAKPVEHRFDIPSARRRPWCPAGWPETGWEFQGVLELIREFAVRNATSVAVQDEEYLSLALNCAEMMCLPAMPPMLIPK
jgi:hypothetical protein